MSNLTCAYSGRRVGSTTNQDRTGFSGGAVPSTPPRPGWTVGFVLEFASVEVMKSVKPDLSDAQMQAIFASALVFRRCVCLFLLRDSEFRNLKKEVRFVFFSFCVSMKLFFGLVFGVYWDVHVLGN